MSKFLSADSEGYVALDEELLKLASGQFDVALIQRVALPRVGIRSIRPDVLPRCELLSWLDLSGNALTSLAGLEAVRATLTRLDVRFNAIRRIGAVLEKMERLEVIKLQGNQLDDRDDIARAASLPALRSISLRDSDMTNENPVCRAMGKDYAPFMAQRFARCRCIDGNYFLHADANPVMMDAGDDDEMPLPQSVPWVSEGYFSSALKGDVVARTAPTEKEVRLAIHDARDVLRR